MSDASVSTNTIVVVGEGSADVSPDRAAMTVTLQSRAASPGEALGEVSGRSQAVLTAAREQGLVDSDLKTRTVSVLPEVDHNSRRVLGYLASYTLEVRIRALNEASKLIDALVDAAGEALRLGGFHLAPSDTDSARAEAATRAVQDARARADRLAGAAGVRVGRVLSIAEDSLPRPGRPFPMRVAAGAATAAARPMPPMEPGSDEVSVQVRVTFEIAD